MPTKYVKKEQQQIAAAADERTALSMLPGQLISRRLLGNELRTVRELAANGRPELIALMPGLEGEVHKVDIGLRLIYDVLVGSGVDMSEYNGTHTPAHDTPSHQPKMLLPAAEPHAATEEERQRSRRSVMSIDARQLIGTKHVSGRVTTTYRMLAHIVKHGGINVKEFVERWKGEFIKLRPGNVTQYISWLRVKHRIKFQTMGKGTYLLQTQITGAEIFDQPDEVRHGSSRAGRAAKHAEPVSDPVPVTAAAAGQKFEGSQEKILMQEFAASNNRINIKELHQKYNLNRNAFHAVMSILRGRGYRFEAEGNSVYTLSRVGKG